MRTNVVLDENLIQEALRISGAKTKKSVIHRALEEFIQNHKRMDLRELKGKIRFKEGYNYKKLRHGS